jgi:putative membrane protein
LACVLVAGIYGGITASKKIIYIQALPALLALMVLNLV